MWKTKLANKMNIFPSFYFRRNNLRNAKKHKIAQIDILKEYFKLNLLSSDGSRIKIYLKYSKIFVFEENLFFSNSKEGI